MRNATKPPPNEKPRPRMARGAGFVKVELEARPANDTPAAIDLQAMKLIRRYRVAPSLAPTLACLAYGDAR